MSKERRFYVYVLFRPWDGTPCYVGKGQGNRWRDHNWYGEDHYNPHMANIYKKAGGPLPVVKVREGLTNEEAVATEVALIAAIGRGVNGPLANLTDGGDGVPGHEPTAEHRAKVGAFHRGRKRSVETVQRIKDAVAHKPPVSDETREKLRTTSSGRLHSPESRVRMSLVQKGRQVSSEARVNMRNAQLGKVHSDETRAKMRETQQKRREAERAAGIRPLLGLVRSEETRAKMAASRKGQKRSPEFSARMSEVHKGKCVSPETRAKQSAARKAYFQRLREQQQCPKSLSEEAT